MRSTSADLPTCCQPEHATAAPRLLEPTLLAAAQGQGPKQSAASASAIFPRKNMLPAAAVTPSKFGCTPYSKLCTQRMPHSAAENAAQHCTVHAMQAGGECHRGQREMPTCMRQAPAGHAWHAPHAKHAWRRTHLISAAIMARHGHTRPARHTCTGSVRMVGMPHCDCTQP